MSSSTIKLGKDATINRNSGSYNTPTWAAITNVGDVTLNLEKDEDDISIRGGGGWELTAPTLTKASVDFDMNHDPTDTDWTALHTAFVADTSLELFVADGTATTGAQGLRATFVVTKFTAKQPLKGAQKDDVTVKPTIAANAPQWFTAP